MSSLFAKLGTGLPSLCAADLSPPALPVAASCSAASLAPMAPPPPAVPSPHRAALGAASAHLTPLLSPARELPHSLTPSSPPPLQDPSSARPPDCPSGTAFSSPARPSDVEFVTFTENATDPVPCLPYPPDVNSRKAEPSGLCHSLLIFRTPPGTRQVLINIHGGRTFSRKAMDYLSLGHMSNPPHLCACRRLRKIFTFIAPSMNIHRADKWSHSS